MEEALVKRIMPNSLEAEQSVIGSMIMDKEAIMTAGEILIEEDFYHKQYGILFESMLDLFNAGEPVDLITLQNKLKEKDVPAEISSLEFVRDLVTSVPTSANVKYYANIVKEKAVLRKLIKTTQSIEDECYLGKESVEDILADTEKSIFNLVQNRGGGDYVPIKQVVINALDKIEKASKQKGSVTGIATGFVDLDYQMAGLQPSDLILIAARPSMGKTAFVLNIAQYVAIHSQQTTAIFSLEMSKEQLVNRMFSLESRVDAQKLRSGNLTDADWEMLIEGAGNVGRSKLIIDDTPGISISELRSKCRKYKLEHDLKLIIIDYLQLMSGSGRHSESRQQEISDISRSLKALARELNVPVVALSQLSRAVEQRPDHRPMLSDLRESGAIEQDADVVMFIYRDDYYNKDSEMKGISEIIVAKQRNGPIGTVNLVWLPQYTEICQYGEINIPGCCLIEVASISEKIGRITAISNLEAKPHLRKNNRIKSIHSSLKIEANSLTFGQVRDVINGKTVFGEQREIQEVKNAYAAYERLSEINPYNIRQLKQFHGIMTKYLVEESGEFRSGEEGVFNGNQCIFMAPPAQLVPQLMDELFTWMKEAKDNVHPLILSSVFHYEFVFIHPFSDGNGRMARLWHTAILSDWKPVFEYIPIESQIEKFQDEYYDAISRCHVAGESTIFIEFMLAQIDKILDDISVQISEKNEYLPEAVQKLLEAMEYDVPYTSKALMEKLGLSSKEGFRRNYLHPSLKMNLIQMTIPDKPNSRNQRYVKS